MDDKRLDELEEDVNIADNDTSPMTENVCLTYWEARLYEDVIPNMVELIAEVRRLQGALDKVNNILEPYYFQTKHSELLDSVADFTAVKEVCIKARSDR